MASLKPNPVKALLRDKIQARVAALTAAEKARQSQIVFDKVINHPFYKTSERVGLYMSTDQEVDAAPIIAHVKARGASAFVPHCAGEVMRMLKLEQGDETNMPLTRRGIAQHTKDQKRENALETGGLDLVIVPGVAFTKAGARMGHGGGYIDKLITILRRKSETAPKVIGVAFDCQVLDDVPMGPRDQLVDDVLFTE